MTLLQNSVEWSDIMPELTEAYHEIYLKYKI